MVLSPSRTRRFVAALALLWYVRKTVRSLRDNHKQLQRQSSSGSDSSSSFWILVSRVCRYTFVSQLIASLEYLIPLVKPALALRIGRLLVWKGRNAVSNLSYGPHARNTIDLYGVSPTAHARKPVLLFVHGGAWSYGHKWQYGLVGQHLAEQGFLVGVINYRTYPTGNVRDQVEDVGNAVRWMVAHPEAYGGDRNRFFVSGHSSGAHVTALALAHSAAAEEKESTIHHHIQGFIGLAGPYDIAEHYEFEANRKVGPIDGVHEISTMKPAMLGEDKFDEASPTKLFQAIHARDVALPRFHIVHGTSDHVVPPSSSMKLADNLRESGHHVEYVELDKCTHEDIVFAAMGDNVAVKRELVALYKRIARV